jgi:hypothetical protein
VQHHDVARQLDGAVWGGFSPGRWDRLVAS